jgi:hypothetical protein
MRKSGLLAFLVLQACVAGGQHGIRPLRPLELAVAPYSESVTARLTGSLMYEEGCLLFRQDGIQARILPIWPTGSVFNGTSVIFHQPGKADQPVLIGEQLVIEGEAQQWLAMSSATYAPFQRQCGAQPFFVSRIRPAD